MAQSTAQRRDTAQPRRATYQDVLDAPPHRVAEIVDGMLYINPRPPTLQALAKTRLVAGLGHAFGFGRGGPGGWLIMHEPELHLGEDILVPDVAGWSHGVAPGDCSPEALTRSGQGDFHHPAPPLMCLVATPPISARQPAAGEAGSVPTIG